ncbi:hypothetical protein BC941DRAFT_491291 [Chlamydoabsidia padenii]|nr:hypothetical protein BC941DRAFT_491291 [Chlamydoabsidia padenii]
MDYTVDTPSQWYSKLKTFTNSGIWKQKTPKNPPALKKPCQNSRLTGKYLPCPLDEIVFDVSAMVKFLPVTQSQTNIIVIPERVKTKGRPTKKETNKRVPIIEKINQQATPAKLLMAKWESNSCFIDAVVEVFQRVIIPGIGATIEGDGKDNSVVTLLGRLQELSNKKNYFAGTKLARNYFWQNGFVKGAMGNCQDIYHKLTDAWPLDARFSFSDQDLNLVKAFEVIRLGYSRTIGRLFSKYRKKQTEYPPEFITINDMISGTYLEDEYDYPVLFITHERQHT